MSSDPFPSLIRPGTSADIPSLVPAYVTAWRETYRGLAPDPFVDGLTEQAAARIFTESLQPNSFSYFLHVAEQGGRIVGFADGGKERSHPEKGIGELYAIYLLKEAQGRGIGRALFEAARKSLWEAGMGEMVVWVLDQSPARKFYEAMGGKLLSGTKRLELGKQTLILLSYQWRTGA